MSTDVALLIPQKLVIKVATLLHLIVPYKNEIEYSVLATCHQRTILILINF